MILVTKPYIPNISKYMKYISRANKNEWLTNFGPLHQELTARLEDYLGVKNLLLVSNGTLALQIAYRALELNGEVLTTPFSFVATSSALAWENLFPRYIDIKRSSLCMDPQLLPNIPKNKICAVQAVHVYGNPADTKALDTYCRKYKLKMIYDGAHAFGVRKSGKSLLLAGDATTLSFHATKVFHTIEGGAVIFKSKTIYERAKQLSNFGYNKNKDIKMVGINSKLNEYQAAVGLVILDEIDSIMERRNDILNKYYSSLKDLVEIPVFDEKASKNGAYVPIILNSEKKLLQVSQDMAKSGIQTRRYFYPSLNTVKGLGQNGQCPISEDIASRILCLPIYTSMTKVEQAKVISSLKSFL